MNCNEMRPLINEFIDGDLSRLSFDEARIHVDECDACAAEVSRARGLVEIAASLPGEMDPPEDLWSGIAAGIGTGSVQGTTPAARKSHGWSAWQAGLAAAMVLILVAAGLMASKLFTPGPAAIPEPGELPAAVEPAASGSHDPVGMGEAGRVFLHAKQELREAFGRQRGSLSPATVKQVEENLALIESAVEEIETSLRNDPGNRQLERMLVAAQQREITFLRKVTQTAVLQQRW